MIKSMTGFGRSTIHHPRFDLTVEIRTINHRFLDITINIPRQLSHIEDKAKQLIRQSLSRGKVDLYLTLEEQHGQNEEVVVNERLCGQYLYKIKELGKQFGVEDDIRLSHLLSLPDLFTIKEQSHSFAHNEDDIYTTIQSALDQVIIMREKEGANLTEDIKQRLKGLVNHINDLQNHAPSVIKFYQERLHKRMQEVLESHMTYDEQRILNEVAVYSDKVNVDEELTRLLSHIDQFVQILAQDNSVGRKLDFLIQEMNREINTIGSKGNNIHISQLVVEIKSELEKIREQVQNIE